MIFQRLKSPWHKSRLEKKSLFFLIDVLSHTFNSLEEHTLFTSLSRNRISNISFTISSVGEVFVLAIMIAILKGVKSDESTENNTKAFSILIAFAGGIWRDYSSMCIFLVSSVPQCCALYLGSFLRNDGLVCSFLEGRHC